MFLRFEKSKFGPWVSGDRETYLRAWEGSGVVVEGSAKDGRKRLEQSFGVFWYLLFS